MIIRIAPLMAGAAALGLALAASAPAAAQALSNAQCSAKYQAAKTANTLNGRSYFAFRRDECLAQPAADQQPAAAGQPAANPLRPAPAAAQRPAPAPAATGNAVFPRVVDPKYASLRPAQARLKTCSDQYNANKATNANGGMKWIEKGGGYWSACNKAIKS